MNKKIKLKTVDGFKIAGTHTTSQGKGLVLWLHGITVNQDEYQDFFKDGAEYLSNAGYDSVRIDFRGHGKSSGSSLDFSIAGQMLDVQAALAYMKQSYSDLPSLIIVGCSFGAPPALFAASQNHGTVKGVVLIAPVLSYERTFLKPETEWAKSIFNDQTLAKLDRTNRLYFDRKFPITSRLVEEMRLIEPETTLQKLRLPVSIIHGDADSMVPFAVSLEFAKACPRVKFFPFSNMDHGFADSDDESGRSGKSLENKLAIDRIIESQFL
jgi:pimeloyl-ACP methyl ester carboxylesterase